MGQAATKLGHGGAYPPSAKAWTIRPRPFFPGTPPTRGIFSRVDPQRASRPAFPRIASPRDIRERYVRVVSRRSFRASRLGRPTPTLPAGSTFVDPSRKFCQLTLRFSSFRLLFHADSGDWQGWGAPDIHDDDGEPRALASLLRQPLQRQPPQLDRRARPSQIRRPPQPRRGRRRHPRSRRSAVAMSGNFTRRTRRCDTARLLPTSARDENERRRGGRGERRRPDRPRTLYDHAPVY